MTKTKRKANTAMVFNPNRGLSIGGRSTVRKTARKNPTPTAISVNPRHKKRVHHRRRKNPSTASGLLVAAVMAGVGVSIFDVVTQRIIPQTSPLVRVAVKLGGAWLFQSQMASKIPVLGKHKNDIALVLGVAGVVDLMQLYVLPLVSGAVSNLTGGNLTFLPQAAAADGSMGNIYGNAPTGQYVY